MSNIVENVLRELEFQAGLVLGTFGVNAGLFILFSRYSLIGLNRIDRTIAQNIGSIKSIIKVAKSRLTTVNKMINAFLLFI